MHLGPTRLLAVLTLLALAACGSNTEELNQQLVDAVRRGDTAEAQRLLQAGAQVDARDAKHDAPAVLWAAHDGQVAVLAILLDGGGDVESAKADGDTALWYAAQQGQLDAARLLLERGANPNPRGPDGSSAVAIAEQKGYGEIAALLRQHGGR